MEKYHKTDICPIEKENERNEDYVGANECINHTRTKENYRLVFRRGSYTEFINARLKELGYEKAPRKDSVLMASFVVGSDREFFNGLDEDEQNRFFRDCAKFFAERYGRKNVISAVVHNDETTPHMHLNLMPITPDGRLCCKQLFNKPQLQRLQTDFYEQVGKRWNLERGKEGSQAKHLSIAEFKAKRIVDDAIDKSTEILSNAGKQAQAELERIEQAVQKADDHFADTMKEITAAKAERDKLIEERNAETDYTQAIQDAKQGKFAKSKNGLRNQIAALTAENQRLEKEIKRQHDDNDFLFEENQKLEKDKEKFSKMSRIYSLFRTTEPEAFSRVFYRATSLFDSFIPKGEPIANVGKSRLQQIEEEIAREKAPKSTNKKLNSKGN